jgi:hypothetical protein
MLDILSVYVGKSGWDEFVFNGNIKENNNNFKLGFSNKIGILVLVFGVLIAGFFIWKFLSKEEQKLEFQNSFTKDSIAKEEVKAYFVEDTVEKQIDINSSTFNIDKATKVVLKSPFYKPKVITILPNEPIAKVELNPNDYAMMLKAFMKSDIKDWQTRKEQLNKILSDNLEVMVMLQNNLGAEYFNKQEFSQKVILPTASLKKLKIVELKQENDNKISFLRLTTE